MEFLKQCTKFITLTVILNCIFFSISRTFGYPIIFHQVQLFIIYAMITEQSVGKLLTAGIVTGIN